MTFEENRAFFKKFGERLAALRKAKGVTQTELAEATGYSQQQIQSFEKGRRRMPLSVVPDVVEKLGVTYEELLGVGKKLPKLKKRGPPSRLERQIERLAELPKSKQKVVSEMLDGLLQQAS